MNLLDLVFPKQCVSCKSFGSYLCEKCLEKVEYLDTQICAYCYKAAINGGTHPRCFKKDGLDGVVSLTNYQTPIKETIKTLKYRFTTDLISEITSKLEFKKLPAISKEAVLLPLPLHKQRQNIRGFNQAELLGKEIAAILGIIYRNDLLVRNRETKSQVGLSQGERAENVKVAFSVQDKLQVGKCYIFDDVWTSGATLKEAAGTLKKAGAKEVWGLTLAHPR